MRSSRHPLLAAAALSLAAAMPFAGAQTSIQTRPGSGAVSTGPGRRTLQRMGLVKPGAADEASMLAAAAKRARRAIKATRDWERREAGQRWRRFALGFPT